MTKILDILALEITPVNDLYTNNGGNMWSINSFWSHVYKKIFLLIYKHFFKKSLGFRRTLAQMATPSGKKPYAIIHFAWSNLSKWAPSSILPGNSRGGFFFSRRLKSQDIQERGSKHAEKDLL